jgi:hypothetical protein
MGQRLRTTRTTTTMTHFKSLYIPDKPRGASPLTMCCNIDLECIGGGWGVGRILGGGWGVGGLEKGGNAPRGLWIHRDVN